MNSYYFHTFSVATPIYLPFWLSSKERTYNGFTTDLERT